MIFKFYCVCAESGFEVVVVGENTFDLQEYPNLLQSLVFYDEWCIFMQDGSITADSCANVQFGLCEYPGFLFSSIQILNFFYSLNENISNSNGTRRVQQAQLWNPNGAYKIFLKPDPTRNRQF